jgi:hypothetical protein
MHAGGRAADQPPPPLPLGPPLQVCRLPPAVLLAGLDAPLGQLLPGAGVSPLQPPQLRPGLAGSRQLQLGGVPAPLASRPAAPLAPGLAQLGAPPLLPASFRAAPGHAPGGLALLGQPATGPLPLAQLGQAAAGRAIW